MSARSSAIQDREQQPWTAERKPDPTPEQSAVGRAALAFAAADRALRRHTAEHGAAGPAYEERTAAWRRAYRSLMRTAAAYEGTPDDVED
jgi:hypothetical protein